MNNNKQQANLHRDLASKLDYIASLEEVNKTQADLIENYELQLKLGTEQFNAASTEAHNLKKELESIREIGIKYHQELVNKNEFIGMVSHVFEGYTEQDFVDLELTVTEAKCSLSSASYESVEEFEEEEAYYDNLICLSQEVKAIKEKYYGEGEEELFDVSD